MCPDAQLYCSGISGNALHEIEWCINRGVDIINMPFGENNPDGYYNVNSAFIDYAVKNYDVVGVAAVGNGGEDEYIANPALAYNVISVGDMCSSGDPTIANSLKTRTTRGKPTLITCGNSMYIQGFEGIYSGSSLACSLTTSYVAMLLEEYPILKTKPMQVVSLFAAGCIRVPGHTDHGGGTGFSDTVGAGRIDLVKTMDTFYKTTTINNTLQVDSISDVIYEWDVYVSAGVNLRAVFSWPATPNLNDPDAEFTGYTAAIFDSEGFVVGIGGSIWDNINMAECITETEGTYYIRLIKSGPLVGEHDKIYFAYRYR